MPPGEETIKKITSYFTGGRGNTYYAEAIMKGKVISIQFCCLSFGTYTFACTCLTKWQQLWLHVLCNTYKIVTE